MLTQHILLVKNCGLKASVLTLIAGI